MIVMQTTRLENVGAFCGVCGGVTRAAVYLFLIFLLVQLWDTYCFHSLSYHWKLSFHEARPHCKEFHKKKKPTQPICP
ncbi:rCG28809, partial [Rattus norvegicus]